jgi:ubiquinone/menaquinone biosynthesis C-methylase UbiE
MRRMAVAQSSSLPNITFLNFPAEALPFRGSTVDAIFVAQALHWFDRPRFYAEAARVLRPGGVLGLIENNRSWRESPFLADYERLLERYGTNYSRDYRRFDIESELAAISGLDFERRLSSSQVFKIPKASFADWSFTSTKMQACVANAGEQQMRDLLSELVERYFADESAAEIPYETELFIAHRT